MPRLYRLFFSLLLGALLLGIFHFRHPLPCMAQKPSSFAKPTAPHSDPFLRLWTDAQGGYDGGKHMTPAAAQALLRQGGHINARDQWGQTALMQACDADNGSAIAHTAMIQFLLRNGAAINIKDDDGKAALIHAAQSGDISIVRLLLKHGARVDPDALVDVDKIEIIRLLLAHGAKVDGRDQGGNTALIDASCSRNLAVIHFLLAYGAQINLKNKDGETPLLMSGGFNGSSDSPVAPVSVAQILIAHGANINAQDNRGRTLLMQTADVDLVSWLLTHGANPEIREKGSKPALSEAIAWGNSQIIPALLDRGANLNAKDNAGHTALMWSIANCTVKNGMGPPMDVAMSQDFSAVKMLVEKGPNLEAKDNRGETALLVAARFPDVSDFPDEIGIPDHDVMGTNLKVIQLLLAHGADVHAHDRNGNSALALAAQNGNVDAIPVFLERGLDVNAANIHGETPLLLAFHNGNPGSGAVALLLNHGAEVNVHNADGDTPLILAAQNAKPDTLRLLLDKGADIHARNNKGVDAMLAAAGGDSGNVDVLLTHGADLESRLPDGTTPLIAAAANGNREVVQRLLAHGADVRAHRSDGSDALIAAIHRNCQCPGDISLLVHELLDAHADVHTKNKKGQSALSLARQQNLTKVVALLKSAGAK